jgi:nitrous oxidase accessory protein NosD
MVGLEGQEISRICVDRAVTLQTFDGTHICADNTWHAILVRAPGRGVVWWHLRVGAGRSLVQTRTP